MRGGREWVVVDRRPHQHRKCLWSPFVPPGPRPWTPDYFFLFRRTGSHRTRSSTELGNPHSANPRALGVPCPLLTVEGKGAQPRASGIGRQVWPCSADAGVCHAWRAAGKVNETKL